MYLNIMLHKFHTFFYSLPLLLIVYALSALSPYTKIYLSPSSVMIYTWLPSYAVNSMRAGACLMYIYFLYVRLLHKLSAFSVCKIPLLGIRPVSEILFISRGQTKILKEIRLM